MDILRLSRVVLKSLTWSRPLILQQLNNDSLSFSAKQAGNKHNRIVKENNRIQDNEMMS